jgi:hypothetical protein
LPATRAEGTRALAVAVDHDNLRVLALVFAVIGQFAWACRDSSNATLLHAGAETLRSRIGFVHPAPRARELENELNRIRAALGRDDFNSAWKTGTSLTKEELTTHAAHVLQNADSSPRSGD